MGQYTSYYLYQKFEKRDGQDFIPVYPNTYSIDADGTMPRVVKNENDENCGYVPPTPTYRWITITATSDPSTYICDECPGEPIYTWAIIQPTSDPSSFICDDCPVIYRWENSGTTCVGYDKYQRAIKQASYDGGLTWENVYPPEYSATTLIEADSEDCGYAPEPQYRTITGTPYCCGYNKCADIFYQVSYDDGATWETTASGSTITELCAEGCDDSMPYSEQYLTFIPLEECTFSADVMTAWYSDDCGETWNALYQSQTVTTDKKILIKSGSEQLWPPSYTPTSFPRFSSTGRFNVQGNIMSLAYSDNFLNKTSMPSGYCFDGTFMGCNKLVNAEHLVLPLTALTDYCYDEMFYGCTSLVTTPELPATNLSGTSYCYANMFRGCTSLTTLPNISATTLGNSCYESMFQGCTSLTSVPSNYLPLTSLNGATQCYRGMFRGCTNLTTVPSLPSSALTYYCYASMFEGCASLTSVPSNLFADAALSEGCYNCMFKGCTALTESPDLNATGISTYGYGGMFDGCTSLSAVTCLATNISASNCTNDWLNNVSPTGVFYKAESMTGWTRDESGIPSGWTVYPNEEWVNSGTTCVGYDKYYSQVKIINYSPSVWSATTDTRVGSLIEVNSEDCGYVPTPYENQYLTFEAVSEVAFSFSGTSSSTADNSSIQYSLDSGSTWNTLNRGVQSPTLQAGEKIMWKGELKPAYVSSGLLINHKGIGNFSSTDEFNVEGNVMSLLYGDDFIGQTSLTGYTVGAFNSLFKNCYYLISIENISLPARTLSIKCYTSMFESCASLTTVPNNLLPAPTVSSGCCSSMFWGCSSLTTAPDLPATTMADDCYYSMFRNCTSLTTAPELPATTLAKRCYWGMFYGCSSLNAVTCLATDISATNCTENWVSGVSSSGTFTKNSSMSNWTRGASGIPNNWTVQNA